MSILGLVRRACSFSLRSRSPREPSALKADWRLFGSRVHRVSTTVDVSRGGAFVLTSDPKPKHTPVVIQLATEKGVIERHARVAWSDARGMGLRFTRDLA
jgi:hypothetical protein